MEPQAVNENALKKGIALISFLSMAIAYSVGLIGHAVSSVIEKGHVEEFEVIIFWSGIAELLAWAIFVRWPMTKLRHDTWVFNRWVFPFATMAYGMTVFMIIIGWLFLQSDFHTVFGIAALVGFSFGLTYITLIKSKKIVTFFCGTSLSRWLVLLYPALFLVAFFYVFPNIWPATAFRWMPDGVRRDIVVGTIPQFNAGDDFEPLTRALPGYFNSFGDGEGNTSQTMPGFTFVLQVHCHKIIRLEYAYHSNAGIIGVSGDLHNESCP